MITRNELLKRKEILERRLDKEKKIREDDKILSKWGDVKVSVLEWSINEINYWLDYIEIKESELKKRSR